MKVFCVGIGGIGLSGVAQILEHQGHDVAGSDSSPSEITDRLQKEGITYFSSHHGDNLEKDTDLLVYSEAVPETNPERQKASQLKIKQISYAAALGMLSQDKKTIAITGTHGKTTVTGMMTSVLLKAGLDPTIVIGSKIDLLDHQNFRLGSDEWFLAEACEYRDNFLHLNPYIMLINNLEPDHLDYFKDASQYYRSFQKLAEKVPSEGTVIAFDKDEKKLNWKNIVAQKKIIPSGQGTKYSLKVPGEHNQMNAQAVGAIAEVMNVQDFDITTGLEKFNGTWRRFEFKGELNGAKLYDDYGHHPTEIEATLQGTRELYPDKKIVIVFQPHQYSRTRELFDEFVSSFSEADEVWITDIYQARDSEKDIAATSAEQLAQEIGKKQQAHYVPQPKLAEQIQEHVDQHIVVLIMGAGNITKVFDELILI